LDSALRFRILGPARSSLLLNATKMLIIGFLSYSLLGNFEPFYEGHDSYVHALASVNLSKGIFDISNELLQETGRSEFAGDRWIITDYNTAVPRLPGIGIAAFGALFFLIGGYYGLFYLTPIFTILLLIISERVATSLFGKYVGLFTLSCLATSNLLFRNSINLQTESLFSVFFVLGSFYLIKYLRHKRDRTVLLASTFFAVCAAIRTTGMIIFPIEIVLIVSYFVIQTIRQKKQDIVLDQKNVASYYSRMFFTKLMKKTNIKIFAFILIPWVVFFIFYMVYYNYYFGNPLTNYGEVINLKSYETSTSALVTVKNEDVENVKQYSKYLLPYQIPAIHNRLDQNLDDVLGNNWIGIIVLFVLFIALLVSLRAKNKRVEMLVFLLLIVTTVWFYSSITTEARALSGVPGRYMIPVFTLSSMIYGFLLMEFLKWSLYGRQLYKRSLKPLKITVIVTVALFFIFAFYFSNPIQIIADQGLNFKDPHAYASRYPLDMEGLSKDSIIFLIHTDWAIDYGVIPFQPNTTKLPESIALLKQVIEEGYNVYIFKKPTYIGEKDIMKLLVNDYGIVLKDYSKTFCKMELAKDASIKSDDICLN